MINATVLATRYCVELPEWVCAAVRGRVPRSDGHLAAADGVGTRVGSPELRRKQWRSVRGGGGRSGVGGNRLRGRQCGSAQPTLGFPRRGHRHSLAQVALGSWDLARVRPGLELVVNWRPCAMCFSAVLWSGVQRLVVSGDGPDLKRLTGFDEGPVVADWAEQLESRGIEVERDVLRNGAIATYTAYGRSKPVVYNARSGQS